MCICMMDDSKNKPLDNCVRQLVLESFTEIIVLSTASVLDGLEMV